MVKLVRKTCRNRILYPSSRLPDVTAEFVLLLLRRRWFETPLHSLWRRHCNDWALSAHETCQVDIVDPVQSRLNMFKIDQPLSDKETFEISRFAKYSVIYYLLNILNIAYAYIDESHIIHRYKYNWYRTEDGWNAPGSVMQHFIKNQYEPL